MSDDPHDLCPAFLQPQDLPIFMAMSDGEYVSPARYFAADLGRTKKDVIAAQQRFRSIGIADIGPLFSEDDGRLVGRGTWLNKTGWLLRLAMVPMYYNWPSP